MNKTQLIQLAGGQTALAQLLGISQAAISQWGNTVPQSRIWQLKVIKPEWFAQEAKAEL
jgi:DNA-binding transcriptional regulator YdaS (Cro superfamily)